MFKLPVVFGLVASLVFVNAAEYKVRIRNLTWMQPFSPPLVVAHSKEVELFKEGQPASDAIKLMAENGDLSALLELASNEDVSPFICGAAVAEGPVFGGETIRLAMEVDYEACGESPGFSMVAMLINTNDAFVGIDSQSLSMTRNKKSFPPAFDAGSEYNNELCSHIPGPACEEDSGNMEAGPGEGYVHIHRGMHDIGNLSASTYDWRNPVAEVLVFAP